MIVIETKVCTNCGEELYATTEYFHKLKRGKYGLASTCKPCRNENVREYRRTHNDEDHERNKVYRDNNKEKESARKKVYNDNHKESNKIYSKQYNITHKETIKEYSVKNKEKISEKQKKYYEDNKELIGKRNRKWSHDNPLKCNIIWQRRRTKKLKLPCTLTKLQWENIKLSFNNCCCYCGKELPLAQEHFIPLSGGGEYTVNNIIPSCQSCNSSKHDRDFFNWYPKHRHYSKKREKFILKFLNYNDNIQQLTLTL